MAYFFYLFYFKRIAQACKKDQQAGDNQNDAPPHILRKSFYLICILHDAKLASEKSVSNFLESQKGNKGAYKASQKRNKKSKH